MSDLKIRSTHAFGEYVVIRDGVELGKVRKKVERYNLRRPVTVTTWIAFGPDGRRVGDGFWRRRDAVAALGIST